MNARNNGYERRNQRYIWEKKDLTYYTLYHSAWNNIKCRKDYRAVKH